jgi:predicted dehydrogenase
MMSSMAASSSPLRLAIIGAGGIVKTRHLPGWQNIPGLVVTALANSTEASAQAFRDHFVPEATVFSDWQTLLRETDADIIWIGATPHLHACCTVAALESGRHVFCQARMARDLAEARLMMDAALQHPHLVTMLCPPPFGLEEDSWVREIFQDAALGRPLSSHLRSLNSSAHDPQTPIHWRQRVELSGKNTMTLGIFTEVLQRWFGPVEYVSAQSRLLHPVRGGFPVTIPDILQVQTEFSCGMLGLGDFSCIHPGPSVQDLQVTFERGTVRLDFETGRLWRQLAGQAEEEMHPRAGMLRPWQVEADFIHAVRHPTEPRPRPGFADGLAYMEVVEAVWQARLSGARVAVGG